MGSQGVVEYGPEVPLSEYVIETHNLTKRYGPVLAVDNLSLQVPQGGVFGLLGPNGSGKTTTMGMVLGLVRPTSGTFRLFGQETDGDLQDSLHRIGAVVETPALYPYLSGRANLRYFQGISGKGSPQEVAQILEMVGLAGRADSKYSTYSMGMKQRLGIAYALTGSPELLFLDEPTNGLDPAGVAEVRDLIRTMGTGGRTVLLSSHLLHEVEQVCDRVAILSKGKLIAQGKVQDLLHRRGAIRIKTNNDARAASILTSMPWIAGVSDEDGYLVASVAPERSWEVTAALAQQGVYISEMTPAQRSLEEYFLEVTGEDASSGPKGGK
ncbi:MAG: ABC transporter ATP-binding protein [Chloroflexi bacterium]|nr:ABC transporter ATP-binding protein [Chloroflexota bacterium]